ncbi:hypothetical protein BC830DRAFT_1082436 [Chytriomyces sp. MP71]|nr:hypothetical protein BC830DRAFT_1082436 [Chytriomyces sp. MP71]
MLGVTCVGILVELLLNKFNWYFGFHKTDLGNLFQNLLQLVDTLITMGWPVITIILFMSTSKKILLEQEFNVKKTSSYINTATVPLKQVAQAVMHHLAFAGPGQSASSAAPDVLPAGSTATGIKKETLWTEIVGILREHKIEHRDNGEYEVRLPSRRL